jgi:SAM-dependent methyltransferase
MYTEAACAERWRAAMAPRTGDVKAELVAEAAEYFGLTPAQVLARIDGAAERFKHEWQERVRDPNDERAVIRFYNETDSEIFELIGWHAADTIHYRTLVCLDIAGRAPGRRALDYGSGIGSDAIVFADAGFEVTLADVSEPLLAFARWRCERRGHRVRVIDLKTEPLPPCACDVAICFDVLEHIPRPIRTVARLGRALAPGGLLFVHAPFGVDPDRPMHVVHDDPLTGRMRSAGFTWRGDLETAFPSWLWAPRVYESMDARRLDRLGYYVYDVLLPGRVGERLAGVYRRLMPRRARPAAAAPGR